VRRTANASCAREEFGIEREQEERFLRRRRTGFVRRVGGSGSTNATPVTRVEGVLGEAAARVPTLELARQLLGGSP
jgi:hypothetical protein